MGNNENIVRVEAIEGLTGQALERLDRITVTTTDQQAIKSNAFDALNIFERIELFELRKCFE